MITETNLLPTDNGNLESGIVHAANESRFSSAHYSEPLTAFTVGWQDPQQLENLLDFIAPQVPVGRRFEFKRATNAEAFYSESDDVRAIGSAFKRVEYSGDSVNEKTLNKGLTIRVDHDDIAGDDWQERYVQLLMQRLVRNELRRAISALDSAASNTAVTWPIDGTAHNPDKDIRTALQSAADASGLRPNRILMGETAWDIRANSFDAQDNAGAFRAAGMLPEELARKLFVEEVRIMSPRYQSASSSKSAILGSALYAFFAQAALTKDEPATLKRFVTPTAQGSTFGVYLEEHAKFTDLSVEHYSNIVVTSNIGVEKLTISDS